MEVAPARQPHSHFSGPISRLTLMGAAVGILIGLYEAALLRYVPLVPFFHPSDVRWVIWLVPLVNLCFLGLFGLILGIVLPPLARRSPLVAATGIAVCLGLVGFYLAAVKDMAHVMEGIRWAFSRSTPWMVFLIVFASALAAAKAWWPHARTFVNPMSWPGIRLLHWLLLGSVTAALSGLGLFALNRSLSLVSPRPILSTPNRPPNLVLITLDTVRADHLSGYGYGQLTTPNLDRLAARGVLFENAIAPSPWTLDSHASILTELLPHQHGANWEIPLDASRCTLAEILKSHGYETAGFSANVSYGQAGWGMGQGFEVYEDDGSSLRYNLAATLFGHGVVQPLYRRLVREERLLAAHRP